MGIHFMRVCRCLLFTIVVLLGSATYAQNNWKVTTKAGRTLIGKIDKQSDQDKLWIRVTEGNVILTTSLTWSDIVSVELAGKPIEVAELSQNLADHETSAPATFLTEFEQSSPNNHSIFPQKAFQVRPDLTRIEVEAGLINLNRTVELNGLLVAVAAFDNHGVAWPVRGSLSVRLIVQRTDPHTGRVSFQEFQRWSQPIAEKYFIGGVAELPFEFRRASPDFDWALCSSAILNVRLGVHGQGNFEASVPVTIREVNSLRDQMQNALGSRFYRNELTQNTLQDGAQRTYQGYWQAP